jgi:heterodisulfide reductase subunit D
MKPINIILYLCSWGPHAAFQTLQDRRISIPPEIKMVRIPCTGRISKSLLFKPFEVGADGVLLVGCNPGTCRYGGGARIAREHSEDARKLLDLIGLGGERIRHETFLPDADDALLALMENFTARIRELGPTPILPGRRKEKAPIERTAVDAIIARYDAHACQDCGKCTSACPLALSGKNYSPRGIVRSLIGGEIASEAVQQDIWSCLTCGICYQRCPSAVDFPSFIQEIRHVLLEGGEDGHKAHSGVFQSLMRAMTHADIPVKHWDWLPEDIQTDPSGPILFFGGCAPYFDVFFKSYLGARTKMILEDSLRLLNFFDIKPAILSGERCCGHDLLWTGDRENFLALAKLNVDAIAATGAEELVTTCPECYRTFHHDYPANGIEVPFKVSHMYDLLEREIGKGSVGFTPAPSPASMEIREDIQEHDLDRVVIGSCSPRLHEPTFRQMMQAAGLNPYLLEMANLREQCSWVHMKDPKPPPPRPWTWSRWRGPGAAAEPLYEETDAADQAHLVIGGGWPASRPPWIWPTTATRWSWWRRIRPSAGSWPSWTRPFPPWTAPSEFSVRK